MSDVFFEFGGPNITTYREAKVNEVNEKITRREGLDELAWHGSLVRLS